MTVGDRIRQVRIEKDITQQELADCAGVSKQAVYKYETISLRTSRWTSSVLSLPNSA